MLRCWDQGLQYTNYGETGFSPHHHLQPWKPSLRMVRSLVQGHMVVVSDEASV